MAQRRPSGLSLRCVWEATWLSQKRQRPRRVLAAPGRWRKMQGRGCQGPAAWNQLTRWRERLATGVGGTGAPQTCPGPTPLTVNRSASEGPWKSGCTQGAGLLTSQQQGEPGVSRSSQAQDSGKASRRGGLGMCKVSTGLASCEDRGAQAAPEAGKARKQIPLWSLQKKLHPVGPGSEF